jgi:hypothetical protein
MSTSDFIASAAVLVSTVLTLYVTFSDRRTKHRESMEARVNRVEDQTIGHAAQLAVVVGGIQRLDARQERIEDLLFKAFGADHGAVVSARARGESAPDSRDVLPPPEKEEGERS